MEKEKTPGMDASIVELDEMLEKLRCEFNENVELAEQLYAQTESDIRWDNLQHLRIIGNARFNYLGLFGESGLGQGSYSSEDGRWLLMIIANNQEPNTYLHRCGSRLQSLTVDNCFCAKAQLNLGHLTGLTFLRISGCVDLNTVDGLENLTGVTDFEISECHKLTELPGLEKLERLAKLKISGDKLAILPELEQLTALTHLDLSSCSFLRELPGIVHLTGLTHLNLSWCNRLTQLPSLEKLTRLEYLDLSWCNRLVCLPGLEELTQLIVVDLSGCSSLVELRLFNCRDLVAINITGCKMLTALELFNCVSLNALQELESLERLSNVNLSGCSALQVLHFYSLQHVTKMDLSGCISLNILTGIDGLERLSVVNLSGCSSLETLNFSGCMNLTTLDFSGCIALKELHGLSKKSQLASAILQGCLELTEVDLSDCDKLVEINTSWCKSVIRLNLSNCVSLDILPELEGMTQLRLLNLAGCKKIFTLPGLDLLTELRILDLSGTAISVLPESIGSLQFLWHLNLSRMHLKELPNFLPNIAAYFHWSSDSESQYFRYKRRLRSDESLVHFYRTRVKGAEIGLYGTVVDEIDMSIFEQPYEMVIDWLLKRNLGEIHPLNEIKVVFLGDGEAGKSHTIARLMNDGGAPVDYTDQSTPGIVIKDREHSVDGRKFRIHYWDFGGQEIMHSMHRIFLTKRTMYVILLNARDDIQSERAKYWLHNVNSFAPDAPVLLVLNKIDQNENASVDERDLRSRYDMLTQVVKLSAKNFSQDEFNNCFTNVLLKEIQNTGFLDAEWPTAWTKVKERLENMESHYIMGNDYQAICQECHVDENQKNLLHWFNDLGVSFCYCDDNKLEDYVILRPDWITNALYIILFNPLEGARNGLIPHESIYTLLKNAKNNPTIRCTLPQARYTVGDIDYVLRIMRKFNLSFTDGHENEFIPMLCQQDSMVDIRYYQKDEDTLEFHMEFDYLPNNLLHRLMVERYGELDMTTVWRTGARFRLDELGYSAVVVIDSNILRFFVRHTNPMHRPNTYLTMLKVHVDRIVTKIGLKVPTCQLIYKLEGKREEFEYELMKEMMDAGESSVYSRIQRKRIPIMDIINQSAPDDLKDEKQLLDQLIRACGNIQDELIYRLIPNPDGSGYTNGQNMENLRNRRIRDNLINAGYRMNDQTQRGVSSTEKSVGELDMLVYNDSNIPWTIIEALRVSSKEKSDWNRHLKKLTENYNTRGFPALYLLTYVDADAADFAQICNSYQDHIKTYNSGQLRYVDRSFSEVNISRSQFTKVVKCHYSSGGYPIAVYHIFARIPIKNR